MENNPFQPNSYEGPDDKDGKDKSSEKKKKRTFSWRAPLPASEFHNAEPRRETEKPKSEDTTETQPSKTPTETAGEADLWKDFDATTSGAVELSAAEREQLDRALAAESATEPAQPTAEQVDRPEDLTAHQLWEEFDTIHLNDQPATHEASQQPPASNVQPVTPRTEGNFTAPEAAASNPHLDQESAAMWNELRNAPPAEAPGWHPESTGNINPHSQEAVNDEFANIMAASNMNENFVAATSEQVPTQFIPAAEAEPTVPETPRPTPASPGSTPRFGGPNPASVFGRAAEAAAITAATVGAAEAGLVAGATAGAAAGALTGAAAGGMMANRNRGPIRQLSQETARQGEQLAAMSSEQRRTNQTTEQLTQANQQLSGELHYSNESKAAAIAAAAAAAEAAMQEQENEHNNEHEVSSAWHTMVVDKHTGKMVQREGVNEFGQGLKGEQRAENNSAAGSFTSNGSMSDAHAAYYDSALASPTAGAYQQDTVAPQEPALPSGQIGYSHELGSGQADPQHLLPMHKNPIVTAITSPLLWVGVGVLLIAFFAAALL
ncbi:MAG TPA: hypothetical protein VMR45_02020 [Patescibacteria group bacterium]|nr:hypothetical protein [Patescibacteria group bacterium]